MIRAQEIIEETRAERVPDLRLGVLDVRAEARADRIALIGEATDAAALEEIAARISALPGVAGVDVEVVLLPDPALDVTHAIVRAAAAPVYAVPEVSSAMISQVVLGARLEILARSGLWWRVRGDDGYIGWIHHGYVVPGDAEWGWAWEHRSAGEPVVSIGADLVDEEDRLLMRLPWGARAVQETPGRYLLPDGTRGRLGAGEMIGFDRLPDRFPRRPDSVTRSARRWMGTPYLWGGVTPGGSDCSGFVQAIYWMHGLGLPRDSDMQSRVGDAVAVDGDFSVLRPGDLLFFAERAGVVSHVGMALGESRMIHSSLSNGGVAIDDLSSDAPTPAALRRIFVNARRLLPD